MSLSGFLTRTRKMDCEAPTLAKDSQFFLDRFNDDDLFTWLYNSKFNNYSLELTISPKSSPVLQQTACGACGATSLRDLDDQEEIMITLLTEITDKFKLNILGSIEEYKDKKNLHMHCIINNIKESQQRKLKDHIKQYYNLYTRSIINLKPVHNMLMFKKYMIKDSYSEYFYHHTKDSYDKDVKIHLDNVEKQEQIKADKLNSIYECPIKEHLAHCAYAECPICDWISTRQERIADAGTPDASGVCVGKCPPIRDGISKSAIPHIVKKNI